MQNERKGNTLRTRITNYTVAQWVWVVVDADVGGVIFPHIFRLFCLRIRRRNSGSNTTYDKGNEAEDGDEDNNDGRKHQTVWCLGSVRFGSLFCFAISTRQDMNAKCAWDTYKTEQNTYSHTITLTQRSPTLHSYNSQVRVEPFCRCCKWETGTTLGELRVK